MHSRARVLRPPPRSPTRTGRTGRYAHSVPRLGQGHGDGVTEKLPKGGRDRLGHFQRKAVNAPTDRVASFSDISRAH